jgi:circadian clock protein KaiC
MLEDRTAEGPDLQLHSIAHAVISLEAKSPPYGSMRRQLEVRKFRASDFSSGLHDFSIEHTGIKVFARLVASDHLLEYRQSTVQSNVKSRRSDGRGMIRA